jgi:hypothetical protein
MRKRLTFLLFVITLVFNTLALGESITFTFANRDITGTTPKYLEFDVMAQAGTAGTTRLGDTQIYINYDEVGFGSSIAGNDKITVTKGTLTSGELVPGLPLYTIINVADNTSSKVAITIGYNYSGSPTSANLLPTSATQLIHIKIEIADQGQNANLSFDESSMSNQQYQSDNNPSNRYSPVTATDTDNGPLPIQMASFAASVVRHNDVEVGWKTVSETNNYGFEVYRKRGEAGEWTKIGFVEGHGTTLAPQSYSYIDRSLSFGEYFYRVKQIDLDGKSETFPEMAVTVGAGVEKFVLAQNYPNPFNPSTIIEFVVPVSGYTTLRVYNVLGQEVATLFEGNAETGKINSARFDASSLPSGLYFYTLKNTAKTETKRMLLVK